MTVIHNESLKSLRCHPVNTTESWRAETREQSFGKQYEVKEEYTQVLQGHLALAENKLAKANKRCEALAEELVSVRGGLQQSLQVEHTQPHPSNEENN